jgi:hypothetical protein
MGSMTLTLYTAHVVALWRGGPLLLDDPRVLYLAQVAVAVALAFLWRSYVGRGPLEALAAVLDRGARRAVPTREPAVSSSAGPTASEPDHARVPDADRVARVEHE